jgi:hypothetical protein
LAFKKGSKKVIEVKAKGGAAHSLASRVTHLRSMGAFSKPKRGKY